MMSLSKHHVFVTAVILVGIAMPESTNAEPFNGFEVEYSKIPKEEIVRGGPPIVAPAHLTGTNWREAALINLTPRASRSRRPVAYVADYKSARFPTPPKATPVRSDIC